MPTRIDRPVQQVDPAPGGRGGAFDPPTLLALAAVAVAVLVSGCGGEPTARQVGNARAFEALLTAVSLKQPAELEKDARAIEERHASGELSEGTYRVLSEVIAAGRSGDWSAAEKRAYQFRQQFGDRGAFFD